MPDHEPGARPAVLESLCLLAAGRMVAVMAKLGLACGREAYGDDWLDSRQARILSNDLLTDRPPRFAQRSHHPPVEKAWPFEPAQHRLWIQPYQDTAVLHIVLFGQVLGGVPAHLDRCSEPPTIVVEIARQRSR